MMSPSPSIASTNGYQTRLKFVKFELSSKVFMRRPK